MFYTLSPIMQAYDMITYWVYIRNISNAYFNLKSSGLCVIILQFSL